MKNKNQLSIMLLLLFALLSFEKSIASSAYPHPVNITQRDGSVINVIMQGDEHLKWAKTLDGYTLVYNSQGIFEYGMLSVGGDLVPSGVKASNINERNLIELSLLTTLPKGLAYSRSQVSIINRVIHGGGSSGERAVTGSRTLICILISYTDIAFTKTTTDFQNLFNQVGYTADGAQGSVKDFYAENSYNQLDLTVDVAGPYTVSNTQEYYGENDGSGDDMRPREMVTEAITLADPDVDFSNYDNDGDGDVDGVYVIYAGNGEEAGAGADAIWAHKWNITAVVLDGKSISDYATSAEHRGSSGTGISRIGVISHELGHALGETDFYDTDYSTGGQYPHTGDWDLMASGTWNNDGITPAHCNPYTKVYTFGWAAVTTLTTEPSVTLLEAANNSNSFYQINTTTAGEYYIMENRQQVGFDAEIPGHGLVIFHKHSDLSGMNTTTPQKFYTVCASATMDPDATPASYGAVNSDGAPFPGTSNNTSFTDASTPSSKSWAAANTNAPITFITEDNIAQTITFCFAGTAPSITLQPASQVKQWGDNVTFTSTAGGSPAPTVQWQRNTGAGWFDISGETTTSLTLTCVTLDMSGYQYRAVFTSACGTTNSDPATLTVNPLVITGTVTIIPNPQQYSDLATFNVVLTGGVICGEQAATGANIYVGTQLMGSVALVINGANLEGSLANIALLEDVACGAAPTGNMAPGVRTVTVVFTGVNSNFSVSNATAPLTITPEDARAYYTGACFASTQGATNGNAIVTLSATIKDITAVIGDAAWDAYPGCIENATLTFVNRDAGNAVIAVVPIGLVNLSDHTIAVGTYNWNVNIGAATSQTYTIGIIVGGYYTRNSSADNTVVTVAKPLSNFVCGGGYIVLTSSGGLKAGDIGSKNNFGMSVKFNQTGNNLQGHLNTIIRRTESDGLHVYQIKANVMTSLAVQPTTAGGKVTFNGKASIRDITNPLLAVSVDGNATLQVKMTDNGQPGTTDSIAITVWNKQGGLWYSSNWNTTTTIKQVLDGGNLKVSSNNSFDISFEEGTPSRDFTLYPNPAGEHVTISFNSERAENYNLRMTDVIGKLILTENISAVEGKNTLEYDFSGFPKGMYYLILSGAESSSVTKVILQ